MNDLRITGVSTHLIRWPLKMKRRHGVGDIERAMPGVIVRISTNGGLVGWGEAAPWSVFTGTAEASAAAIQVYLRPLLLGADPTAITPFLVAADHAVVGHPDRKSVV